MYSNNDDEFEKMSEEEQVRRMEIVKKEAIETACDLMDIIDSSNCKTIEDYRTVFAIIQNRINITDIRFYNYLTSRSSRSD
jgi:hypothetical protein